MSLKPGELREPPVSLYVHMPWCVQKCPYCDFNSHQLRQELPESVYIEALLIDLQQEAKRLGSRQISTVFIGGGTPSLFSAESISGLLSGIKQTVQYSEAMEVTLEANPGTLDISRFNGYPDAGVNRLSVGVQSFADQHLQKLGRIHDGQAARQAVTMARQCGFANLNTDLMHGLPEQTIESAMSDVQHAIDLDVPHISHYQLTLEPDTPFYYKKPVLPEMDDLWEIQLACHNLLSENGYHQYEISAWSKPGHECRHNYNYWQFGDYIGIGAGAHGKLTCEQTQSVTRRWKHKSPQRYIEHINASQPEQSIEGQHIVDHRELPFEFLMNHLRLTSGFEIEIFKQRTGMAIDCLEPELSGYIQQNLLFRSNQGIACTAFGWRHLDAILEKFLPELEVDRV